MTQEETQSPEVSVSQIQDTMDHQDLLNNEESEEEIIEPSGRKNSFTQVTNRDDHILEGNCCKSVQVTDRLHQVIFSLNKASIYDFFKGSNVPVQRERSL